MGRCGGRVRNQVLIFGFIGSVALLVAGCHSGKCSGSDCPGDFSTNDFTVLPDLAGEDLTKVPDLVSAGDMYTPLFSTATYGVDTGPIYLASGSLNAATDNTQDLVVVNTNNPAGVPVVHSTLSVLLGNGDGTFQNKMSTTIDDYPFSVLASSDLNGDGKNDVLIAVYDGFDVLLGDNTGHFGSPTHTTVTDGSTGIRGAQVGDMDGDGKLDVVLVDIGTDFGKIWVSRGNGDGTFNTPAPFVTQGTPNAGDPLSAFAVRLGDMDGDGKLDAVTVNSDSAGTTNEVSILTNTSVKNSGVVSMVVGREITASRVPVDLLLAQLDSKNGLDIVVANEVDSSIDVFLATATSLTYAAAVNYKVAGAPAAITFGDIDGDAKPDLVTANSGNSTVTVLYNSGGGAFGVATANRPGAESYPTGLNPVSVITGNFNADTKTDAATANQGDDNVTVLLNQR
jgi:hypothetical protein